MIEEKNNKIVICSFDKLLSHYSIQNIFHHLKNNKMLHLIRYSKRFQKLLNKNIKDYENESQKIIIEIFPIENEDCKYINFSKRDLSYYHIYFNNNNSEENEKKKCINKKDKIRRIKIIIDNGIESLKGLFGQCKNIKKIDFIKFNNKNIKNMSEMFYCCSSLKELNISKIITNNVTNMNQMFYGCSSIKFIDLTNFNTINVTSMEYMFSLLLKMLLICVICFLNAYP